MMRVSWPGFCQIRSVRPSLFKSLIFSAAEVKSKALGEIALLGQPFTLSRTPSRLETAAPEYNEHADEILREAGYSDDDIARLRSSGAV